METNNPESPILNAVSDLSAARWPDSPQWLMKETAERNQHHSHFAAQHPPTPPEAELRSCMNGNNWNSDI